MFRSPLQCIICKSLHLVHYSIILKSEANCLNKNSLTNKYCKVEKSVWIVKLHFFKFKNADYSSGFPLVSPTFSFISLYN